MRMRKKKHLEPRMGACAHWQEKEPAAWKGRWREKLPGAAEVRLELGCGKAVSYTHLRAGWDTVHCSP